MNPSPYNIPEYSTPQQGVSTVEGGHFYYGNYLEGFDLPRKKVKPHRHPYFEIFYLPEPSGSFLADFVTYPLESACFVFISPGQVHGWPGGGELCGEMIAFDEAFLNEETTQSPLLRSPLFFDPSAVPILEINESSEAINIWRQLAQEFEQKKTDHPAAILSLLKLLLIQNHRQAVSLSELSGETNHVSTASAKIYQQFIKLLHGDIPADHFPRYYAEQIGISPDYLTSTIKEHSGYAAGELIRRRITLEAKRLLAHSNLTIAEIAFQLHFKDPSYFTRFFKKQTNQTPKAFKKPV